MLCWSMGAQACNVIVSASGVSFCKVDLVSVYGPLCSPGQQICLTSIKQALADATAYFKAPLPPLLAYMITIPAGTYDLSQETTLSGQMPNGVFDVTNAGGLSSTVRLVVKGAGQDQTTLITSPRLTTIWGLAQSATSRPVSFMTFESMTLTRPNTFDNTEWQSYSFTQGTVVPVRDPSVGEVVVDITPGYPTPDLLYCETVNGVYTAGKGSKASTCAGTDTSSAFTGFVHAYTTNGSDPDLASYQAGASAMNPEFYVGGDQPGMQTNGLNPQLPWGAVGQPQPHLHLGANGKPAGDGREWIIPFSFGAANQPLPAIYADAFTIACIKMKSGKGAFYFGNGAIPGGGSDIVFKKMRWMQNGQGIFRGGTTTAQVIDSSYERSPAPPGQPGTVPCLAGSDGGPQFGVNADAPTWGNTVRNYTAVSPGDDGLAFDNDIGGTGGKPVSTVSKSTISSSFARDILVDTTSFGPNACASSSALKVRRNNTILDCDGLSGGTPDPSSIVQCPVTYQNLDREDGCP